MDHVLLAGGPAAGRKLVVKAGVPQVTVAARERADSFKPRRHRREGKRDCRYLRTSIGTGSGLIPRRYEFVP